MHASSKTSLFLMIFKSGHRKSWSEVDNFRTKLIALGLDGDVVVQAIVVVLQLLRLVFHVLSDADSLVNEVDDFFEIGFDETARCKSRSAESNAAGHECALVFWNAVLVQGDIHLQKNTSFSDTVKMLNSYKNLNLFDVLSSQWLYFSNNFSKNNTPMQWCAARNK